MPRRADVDVQRAIVERAAGMLARREPLTLRALVEGTGRSTMAVSSAPRSCAHGRVLACRRTAPAVGRGPVGASRRGRSSRARTLRGGAGAGGTRGAGRRGGGVALAGRGGGRDRYVLALPVAGRPARRWRSLEPVERGEARPVVGGHEVRLASAGSRARPPVPPGSTPRRTRRWPRRAVRRRSRSPAREQVACPLRAVASGRSRGVPPHRLAQVGSPGSTNERRLGSNP